MSDGAEVVDRPPPPPSGVVFHWPRAYDLMVWAMMLGRESAYRERLVDVARLASGESILDVGCGTGNLAIAVKRRLGPTSRVHGLDASRQMIARARKKASGAGVPVDFETGFAGALPYPDASFDAVLIVTVLHCLPDEGRRQCIREVRRVLKPGGRLLAVDFGGPAAERRNLVARHLRAHAQFDLGEFVPVLTEFGLHRTESGAIGVGDLRFFLVRVPSGS